MKAANCFKPVKMVDELTECRDELSGSFTRKQLSELFAIHSWGRAHGWRDYLLLTDEEKKIVDDLGLTPPVKPVNPGNDRDDERWNLKNVASNLPGEFLGHLNKSKGFYVLRHDIRMQSGPDKSFYYICFLNSLTHFRS